MTAYFINVLYLVGLLSIPISSGLLSAGFWVLATRRIKIAFIILLCMISFGLLDLAMFRIMPVLGLSFGPTRFPFLVATFIRGLATVGGAILLMAYLFFKYGRRLKYMPRRSSSFYLALPVTLNLIMSGCLVDGLFIEPFSIDVRHVQIASNQWSTHNAPFRIVHITDTHIERFTHREQESIRLVNELEPDVILLTGDYLNISYLHDKQARDDFRRFIRALKSRYGIYAAWGNTDVPSWRDKLVDGLNLTILEDEIRSLHLDGQNIHIMGLDIHPGAIHKDRETLSQLVNKMPGEGFNILLYHTPDLMPEVAASEKFDLYLAGHTHGGQIRLPLYGAIVTSSRYGKQYEAGLYQESRTHLYVNRGLGFEGGLAPRIRFLCRPEITVFTLSGTS